MECEHCKEIVCLGVCENCHEEELRELVVKTLKESDKSVIQLATDSRVANVGLVFVLEKLKEISPENYAEVAAGVNKIQGEERNRVIEPAPSEGFN